MSVYMCVCKFPKWEFKSQKRQENKKQKAIYFSFPLLHCYIAAQCLVRIEYVKASTNVQVAFYRRKNWQPLTICNIAQAGSLCVSNKYLTALFQSFSILCIPDVVTIYVDLKSENVSSKCSTEINEALRFEISRHYKFLTMLCDVFSCSLVDCYQVFWGPFLCLADNIQSIVCLTRGP